MCVIRDPVTGWLAYMTALHDSVVTGLTEYNTKKWQHGARQVNRFVSHVETAQIVLLSQRCWCSHIMLVETSKALRSIHGEVLALSANMDINDPGTRPRRPCSNGSGLAYQLSCGQQSCAPPIQRNERHAATQRETMACGAHSLPPRGRCIPVRQGLAT